MSVAPLDRTTDARGREAAGTRVARIYERHARAVYGLCRLLLRDPHDAEDAAQAAFLAAHGALLRGNTPRDEGAWITAIARNECRSRIRDRMRAPTLAGDDALAQVVDPGRGPDETITDPGIGRALGALPERQREAVVLHDLFGLRAREVGTALGLSLPAVEALLFRARRQLRTRLQPVAGAVTIPLGLPDALARLIPGFTSASAGAGSAAGAGLLAKLVSVPLGAKLVAGALVAGGGTAADVDATGPGAGPAGPTAVPVVLEVSAPGVARPGGAGPSAWPAQSLDDPPRVPEPKPAVPPRRSSRPAEPSPGRDAGTPPAPSAAPDQGASLISAAPRLPAPAARASRAEAPTITSSAGDRRRSPAVPKVEASEQEHAGAEDRPRVTPAAPSAEAPDGRREEGPRGTSEDDGREPGLLSAAGGRDDDAESHDEAHAEHEDVHVEDVQAPEVHDDGTIEVHVEEPQEPEHPEEP